MSAFVGYPGRIWGVCWIAMEWLSGVLAAAPAAAQAASAAQAVYLTLRNGRIAVAAWQAANALATDAASAATLQSMPLVLNAQDKAYFLARVGSLAAAAAQVALIPPAVSPVGVVKTLSGGQPAIPDPKYLEWAAGFTGENPPVGFESTVLSLNAFNMWIAWADVANAVRILQGNYTTQDYDMAARMFRACGLVLGNMLEQASPQVPVVPPIPTALWNSTIAVPALLLDASMLSSAPSTLSEQQAATIRYVLGVGMAALAQFLLSLRRPQSQRPNLATVRQNDSLMDVAARSTGNFEQWASIAAANALVPPYPGPSNPALVGKSLLVPQGGALPPPGPTPTYAANVLGTDFDFGPINGNMPAWNGDYQLISGYLNFARAIGRRIQTTLASLAYHTDYGSRIPPEVGAVQDESESAKLAQYGIYAIQSDPRTGNIANATASTRPGFLATFQALVTPIGPNATPVQVNETINPLP